jgi:hypothetical protein
MIKAKHAQLFTKLEPEGLDIDMAFCKTLRDNVRAALRILPQ